MSQSIEMLPVLLQKARESTIVYARQILSEFGLTEQQWRVIHAAYEHGPMSAHVLAEKSAILGPSLSRILNRLEADGILTRKATPGDLRELTIKLSAAGKRLHNKAHPHLIRHYEALAAQLGSRRSKQLTDLLEYVAGLNQPSV